MSLMELGLEYLRQYETVMGRIRELKATEKGLSRKGQLLLRGRLLALYEDAVSLRETGEHLVNYYGGKRDE